MSDSKLQYLIQSTWDANPLDSRTVIGDNVYPVTIEQVCQVNTTRMIVDHVDGIGTKGYYLWKNKQWYTAAADAFAMNINDLLMVWAKPFKIQDHLTIPEDNSQIIIATIEHLVNFCKSYSVSITGGETSIHTNYPGIELSITMSGEIRKWPPNNRFNTGDLLISLPSTGLHSNGFTKIREIYGDDIPDSFLAPTAIYFNDVFPLRDKINGLMHMTGGAFTKLKQVINSSQKIVVNEPVKPTKLYQELYNDIKDDELMYKTFNCGSGMILSVGPKNANIVLDKIRNSAIIGRVESGNGDIIIQSAFSGKRVSLHERNTWF